MRNVLPFVLALGLTAIAGCVSSVPVASIPCDQACSSSLDCVGSLICHNGTCAPSSCSSCGAGACTYAVNTDGSCTFTSCL